MCTRAMAAPMLIVVWVLSTVESLSASVISLVAFAARRSAMESILVNVLTPEKFTDRKKQIAVSLYEYFSGRYIVHLDRRTEEPAVDARFITVGVTISFDYPMPHLESVASEEARNSSYESHAYRVGRTRP